MTKWRYKVIGLSVRGSDTQKSLNSIGSEGWELIAVIDGIAIFKRPIEDK